MCRATPMGATIHLREREAMDRVALITGGSTGIGRATALAMARQGIKVAITARRVDRCKDAAEEIEGLGGEVLAMPGDVSDAEHMEQLVERTVERWGRLDIVVPNAGINGVFAPIEDLTSEEWDQTQSINARGTFLTVKYAIPHLREGGGGNIVIVSSVNGTRTFANLGSTAYACSKATQVAFAKMAAVELAQWDIRVNVVCPGATRTNIHENTSIRNAEKPPAGPAPRERRGLHGKHAATAEQVAATILFLSSEEACHITGTEVYVDGGVSLS